MVRTLGVVGRAKYHRKFQAISLESRTVDCNALTSPPSHALPNLFFVSNAIHLKLDPPLAYARAVAPTCFVFACAMNNSPRYR